MEQKLGSVSRPLRVAVIGAGPSGFYAVGALIARKDVNVSVDLYDRLPAPYGLVRYGVAPDHEHIRGVIRVYARTLADPRVRFFGNIAFGADVTHEALRRYYDALIYAVGSASDRKMGIPGEELRGSYSATDFVGWYNAHPDYTDLKFDLTTAESAVVVGNGNVAMDVVRVLAKSSDELAQTDVADHALALLRQSRLKKIYMLGRRGPVQAAFTNPELRELSEIEVADVVVAPRELELDPFSQAQLREHPDATRNLETLKKYAVEGIKGRPRQIVIKFLTSPVEVMGLDERVSALKIERNELRPNDKGALTAFGTGKFEAIAVDVIFRAIGYKGVPLPGVPYDARSGTIPNDRGRVLDPQTKQPLGGEYVVGWAKRGPSGVIGTNKPDALETVELLLQDAPQLKPVADADANPEAVSAYLQQHCPQAVSYADWQRLDALETQLGKTQGRPRVKFARVSEMLDAIQRANGVGSVD